jgi:hypothetical protein
VSLDPVKLDEDELAAAKEECNRRIEELQD